MGTRLISALLSCILVMPSVLAAHDSDDAESIRQCFEKYTHSNWQESRQFMTEDAFADYVMMALYAKKEVAQTEISAAGVKDYRLPEMPADYGKLPSKSAIEKAVKIRREAFSDLSSELEDKFVPLIDRVAHKTPPKGKLVPSNIKVSEDKKSATSELLADGGHLSVPMKYRKVGDKWLFDGKDELLFFDRLR